MFSRVGAAAYKKDLGNTILLLQHLDNPHHHFKSIHVAGTNGKGSTSHMLAAIMQTAGYSTGLYTSPHLRDFRERIRVNGEMVSEEFVIDFTEKIKPVIEAIEPSFFEVTVAMAFAWFAAQKVDVAVIETGLGGRLDSTNIITPDISVITNIGWDHMNILGNTLPAIAAEKAGIIKQEVPVVVGEVLPETRQVFTDTAAAQGAPLLIASDVYRILSKQLTVDTLRITVQPPQGDQIQLQSDLPGIYQQHNMLTTYAAAKVLAHSGWALTDAVISRGMAHAAALTGLQGRWQLMHRQPWLIADVAHNADGIYQLIQHIDSVRDQIENVHIIYGTSADKDLSGIWPLWPRDYHYYFTSAQLPRAMPAAQLAALAAAQGIAGQDFPNVMKALAYVTGIAATNDLIMVCGSVFVVGEIDEVAIPALFRRDA